MKQTASEVESGVAPGRDYPVFDTRLGRIGMMICCDGFFPEVARELSNREAEIIAWPVSGCNPLLAQARACEQGLSPCRSLTRGRARQTGHRLPNQRHSPLAPCLSRR
jgi:predicted amidohydrolase